ncbi:membrane protein YqaA, SNARE-associated domain [Pseudidiomarina planktonica]|uniref:Membrane protein YqaA, SNARE-associated domain n=1 Tax=Pseudidiomarina planktonica TaxID=1323738 RepID=A0A1Y6EU07_9GAMM|nr:YqaA family protein [Pseudidiomarina planktonica]RUO65505.1 DedA family protein [Pseudidiomarina planktonica]SMQ64711.1 membrane protein YqaA, SNARE-associated domain [Pseudidiomarina planktonica]
MKVFSALYDKVLGWTQHRRAPAILAGLSFSESVIFPIPPDVMLAPMAMMQPKRAWYFAAITTIFSVLGALVGYALGYLAFDTLVMPMIEWAGYEAKLAVVQQWFDQWGFWIVFIAGFSPIPYKLFTVSGGMLGIALIPFVIASLISRGLRFFLVAWLMRSGGPKMAVALRRYVDTIGWLLVIVAVCAYVWLR